MQPMQAEALTSDAENLAKRLQGAFSRSAGTWRYAPDAYQLQRVTVVLTPESGALVWCYHSSLPGMHILRIWIPSMARNGSIYREGQDPDWGMLIIEEMDTHSFHHSWHFDSQTGGVWLDGRSLLREPVPSSPEYTRWTAETSGSSTD